MGTPVKIVDLARDMIHLAGADEEDIEIVFTGVRPGEKLHEELFADEEELGTTTYDHIMVAHHEPADDDEEMNTHLELLIEAAERRDWAEMSRCLSVIAPAYRPGGSTRIRLPESL
jgi:FlaA1/EpsC-like NDP-sugar epimerase